MKRLRFYDIVLTIFSCDASILLIKKRDTGSPAGLAKISFVIGF